MADTSFNEETQKKVNEIKDSFNNKVKTLQDEFSQKQKKANEDFPDPDGIETNFGVDAVVEWVDTKLSFDLPEFTMNTQTFSFDIPTVTTDLQTISFDVLETIMVTRCVTNGPVWYGPFECRWECIAYADFPEIRPKRIEIKLDLPQISSQRIEWKIDLPEITMKTQEIVMTLPQITIREVSVTITDKKELMQTNVSELTQSISEEQTKLKSEISKEVSEPTRNYIHKIRQEMLEAV